MDTVRRYVFPIIWMIILGAIALALAKMAFFPSGDAAPAADDGGAPAASFDAAATVPVEKGDIASVLDLPATVRADAGKPVTAGRAGEINKVWVENGDAVDQGERLLQVRVPKEPAAPPAPATPGAQPSAAPAAPQEYTYHTLTAKNSGTISGLTAAEGQTIEAGAQIATLSPGTYAIIADLTPEQQLQLLDRKIDASAQLPTRAEPVTCSAPRIVEDAATGSDQQTPPAPDPNSGMPPEGDSAAGASAHLRCPVPSGTKIVPGLSVTVSVDLGTSEGVLTVPTTAVEGTTGTGSVYLVDEVGGEPAPHEVELGRRDEERVEITSGLKEGQKVLQFVPGVDNPDDGSGGPGDGPGAEGW